MLEVRRVERSYFYVLYTNRDCRSARTINFDFYREAIEVTAPLLELRLNVPRWEFTRGSNAPSPP